MRELKQGWPRALRLRRSADFVVLQRAAPSEPALFRCAHAWLGLTAMIAPVTSEPGAAQPLRVGCTVPKRHARRAVDRNLIKRIVRESARRHAPMLCAALVAGGLRADVVVRLRAPLIARTKRSVAERAAASHQQLRRELRSDCDALYARLARAVTARAARKPL